MAQSSLPELEAGLADVRRAPADDGVVRLIVRRLGPGEREVLQSAELDADRGLVGDTWLTRGSKSTPDGSSDRRAQVTLMNARAASLIAGPIEDWPAAGDQLYVDLDLGEANLAPGARLAVGTATLVVSSVPHTGCVKFSGRFGSDALRFVSTLDGRALRLRGMNATIERSGSVRVGDRIHVVTRTAVDMDMA